MKLGMISDTHDNLDLARKAVEFFLDQNVDVVIHCGDVVAPFTAELFDRGGFEFYCVRGNNDGEWNLKSTVEEFGEFYNNIAELEFSGKNFVVYHGTEEEIVDALVRSGRYDYVLRGHTHEKGVENRDGAIEINPGGIELPEQDEEFSLAILDAKTGALDFYSRGDLEQ